MAEHPMDMAIGAAIRLNEQVQLQGVTSAFSELEKALKAFEREGYPLNSIIPRGESTKLGFSLRNADGKTFFETYSDLIRKKLCSSSGEFRKLIESDLDSSVGAVLTAIVASLGIPAVAIGIVVPIAVILTNTGLKAFCEVKKREVQP